MMSNLDGTAWLAQNEENLCLNMLLKVWAATRGEEWSERAAGRSLAHQLSPSLSSQTRFAFSSLPPPPSSCPIDSEKELCHPPPPLSLSLRRVRPFTLYVGHGKAEPNMVWGMMGWVRGEISTFDGHVDNHSQLQPTSTAKWAGGVAIKVINREKSIVPYQK